MGKTGRRSGTLPRRPTRVRLPTLETGAKPGVGGRGRTGVKTFRLPHPLGVPTKTESATPERVRSTGR